MSSSKGSELIENFTNAVVTWEVESFSLIPFSKDMISSPEIILLAPIETKWRIHLLKSNKTLFLKVELLENIFLNYVYLHWSYCILDESEKGLFCSEKTCIYEPKTNLTMGCIKYQYALEIARKKKYDNLIIICRMLVDFDPPIQLPIELRDTGVELLSNSLRKLPTSFIYHDTTTTVKNVKFSLHEAMLYFRGTKLIRFMKQTSNAIDYGDIYFNYILDSQAAEAVLEYLYTGNYTRILNYPSQIISDCIQHLEIIGLEDFYWTRRIKVSSKTELNKQTYTFTVLDFKNKTGTFFERKLRIVGVNSHLMLKLFVEPWEIDPSKKELYGKVTFTVGSLKCVFRLDVSFGKDKNQIFCTRRINDDRQYVSVLEKDHPECFLNETLFIKVHVYRSVGDVWSYIVVNENPTSRKIAYENSFMSLSETLGEMKKTAIHSDFYFKIGAHEIQCHKFLAAARSPLMKELFRRHENLECVEIFDCTKEVFEKFLHYMYVGILTEKDIDKLIELYKFGEPYKVDGLLEDVLQFLSGCINEANMLKILIFAGEINDHKLKSKAFKYVWEKSNILQNHEDLDMFRSKTPGLYEKIQKKMSLK